MGEPEISWQKALHRLHHSDISEAKRWGMSDEQSNMCRDKVLHHVERLEAAVDLHDELVEALKEMDRLLTEDWGDPSDNLTQVRFGHDPCAAWAKIRSVLAKASPTPRKVPDPTGSER